MTIGSIKVLGLAAALILSGTGFYWLFRDPQSAIFLSFLPSSPGYENALAITPWINWLPTFLHVIAFSLLTTLILGYPYSGFSCLLWAIINIVFEVGQGLPLHFIQLLPEGIYIQHFFSLGVFDPADIVAAILGALTAWLIIQSIQEASNNEQTPS